MLFVCMDAGATEDPDSLLKARRTSVSVGFYPLRVLKFDQYVKRWQKSSKAYRLSVEFTQHAPSGRLISGGDSADINVFRQQLIDYNHPSLTFSLAYNFNHAIRMHKEKDPSWGQLEPVDYVSRLGDAIALYGRFNRPLWRSRHLEWNYYLGTGMAYALTHYNNRDAIDDEFIGSHLNIFFTVGTYAKLALSRDLAVKLGIDFSHYSNGAMARPNKGVNYLAPFVGLAMRTGGNKNTKPTTACTDYRFSPYWFMEFSLGVGGKTLLEDWQHYQFGTPPSSPDYRKNHYTFYGAYSLQADLLYRYAPRWASGLGFDLFYGDYADRVAKIDKAQGHPDEPHSPWSVGIALKHETFFGRFSVRVGLGYYFFRQMGVNAKVWEQKYYERVGLHYAFPSLGGLAIGFNVNAHKTRADFTELQISLPMVLSNKKR